MKLFHLLILAVALILNSTTNGLQLQDYLKSTQRVNLASQAGNAIYRDGGIRRESTIQYEQIMALQVAKDSNSDLLYIATNPQENGIDQDTLQSTSFLPWVPDSATFMLLDNNLGGWFFTARLSGCEVWIAHDRHQNSQPLIIHVNTLNCAKEKKLGEREALGKAAIRRFNRENNCRYELLHRIMHDIRDNPEVYPEPQKYLDGLHARFPHVELSIYGNDDDAIFYGMYRRPYFCEDENAAYYGGWTFHLRSSEARRFYQMRESSGSYASILCGWLRYLSRGLIGGRKKREVLSDNICNYMNTTLRGQVQNGKLSLSTTDSPVIIYRTGILVGSVPSGQTLYISELFPTTYEIGAPLNQIPIADLQYNCSSTELYIKTRALDTLTVVPGILELSSITITLNATLSPVGVQRFIFSANWGIGNVNGSFVIEDNLETSQLLLRGGPQGTVSLNFENMIESLSGKRISLPAAVRSVSFRDIDVVGAVDTFSGGSVTFSISGRYGKNNEAHVILRKGVSNSGAKYAAAFVSEFTQFQFSDLIEDLTGVDINGVPFLGSLVVPTMAVTLATADIRSSNLLQVIDDQSLLRFSTGYIQQGFTAYFNLSEMDGTPVKLSYSNSRFSFEVLNGHSVSLSTLLSKVGLSLNSVTLPPGIRDITNLRIMQFSINASSGELLIDLSFPDTLSYFSGLINIQNVVIKVHAVLKAPRTISVEASGHFRIGDQMFDVYIKRDSRNNKYILSSKFFRISISDIIAGFQAAVFPDELNDIIMTSGFYDFSINNLSMSVVLGAQPLQIQMSGSPVINGYQAPYINAIVIRQGGKTNLVEGFELGSTNLADLVQSVSGLNVRSIAVLNQQLEAAILISPVTLPNVRLQGQHLSGFSVNKGISLQATLTWPSDCSSDLFCAAAQTLLGQNARMMLQGTITNTESFNLMAGVSDIRLGSGLTMTQAGFEVRVLGPQIQFGIFGSLHIGDPDITLNAAIRVGTRGIVLDLSMTGCWEQAFGADWLTICSLQGLIALKPELDFLPGGLAFGGQVKIGKPSCSQLQGGGFVGIDVDSPQENYYYVNINGELTFRSVLGAFCINIDLPRPLAESGFPEGFLSSFSLLGKELPHVPLSIPQGYRLKGKFNILGLTATVDINIGLPGGLKAVVLLPPLNLANGLLTMYASRSDSSKGPYLNASIGLIPPNVNIEASGYVSVLGISVDAQLRITNSAYQLTIEGKILRLFQANLEITASYGNIRSASFRVRGRFRNDLCDRVKEIIENALRRSSEEATRAISDAQRVVNEKKAVLDGANRELSQAQAEVNRCQRKFDDAVGKLQKAQADVRGLCTPPSCSDVCVPAPCGTTCIARVWGRCVLVRPTFSSCCFRAPNLVCEAERAGCIAIRETATLALRAVEVLVDQSRRVLDVAIAALEVAKGAVNIAKLPFDAAVAALEAVKQTYRVGVEAGNQIARFGLGGVVNLKEITFDVSLSAAAGGSFGGSVRGCLAGNNVQLNININLHDVVAIARQVAEHVIRGLSSIF